MTKKWALFSVYHKKGIIPLAQTMAQFDIELIATSGTARHLRQADLVVKETAELTGFPEMMDGRVKTLHPKIHGAILAKRDQKHHQDALAKHQIPTIDFLIINFYPFIETIKSGASVEECIEKIDIGAPAMVRAAAKNHQFVTIIVEPEDYPKLADEIQTHQGETSLPFRQQLARKAFAFTSAYDAHIAKWMKEGMKGEKEKQQDTETSPRTFTLTGTLKEKLRYGENPHQKASLWILPKSSTGIAHAKQLQGKALSYNNIADVDAAWNLAREFDEPCVAIIKHANPCGVAIANNILTAYRKARDADPVSAFGGIIAANQTLTAPLAHEITNLFTECVIAPAIEEEAHAIFARKKNLRLLIAQPDQPNPTQPEQTILMVSGGFLTQDKDHGELNPGNIKNVGARQPSSQEKKDMLFAWKVCQYVKSNAIVIAADGQTLGIGAGQMSRLDSAKIATAKLPASTKPPIVAASDAFFPFADGITTLAEAGCTAIIQPGGSMRDNDVIKTAQQHNIAMWLTGIRHFRH